MGNDFDIYCAGNVAFCIDGMANVKIAINTTHTGKMPNLPYPEIRDWWRTFNGDFTNLQLPVNKLIQAIRTGYAYAPQHSQYRKRENFVCGQHVGLDFDASGFDEILADPFIAQNAAFLHSTASHKPDFPRSRAIFVLDRPIYRQEKYDLLTRAFADHWSNADDSCKDAARLFFGAPNCEVHYLGNVLTLETAAEIVRQHKDKFSHINGAGVAMEYTGQHDTFARVIMNRFIAEIASAANGTRHNTRIRIAYAAGGYAAGGVLEPQRAREALISAAFSGDSDYHEVERDIFESFEAGQRSPLYPPEERLDPVTERLFARA